MRCALFVLTMLVAQASEADCSRYIKGYVLYTLKEDAPAEVGFFDLTDWSDASAHDGVALTTYALEVTKSPVLVVEWRGGKLGAFSKTDWLEMGPGPARRHFSDYDPKEALDSVTGSFTYTLIDDNGRVCRQRFKILPSG